MNFEAIEKGYHQRSKVMPTRFLDHEYGEPANVANPGDDFKLLKYEIRNLTTGKRFLYGVEIAESALSSRGRNALATQVQDAVDTDGRSVVEKGLKQDLECETRIVVSSIDISAIATVGGILINVTNRFL